MSEEPPKVIFTVFAGRKPNLEVLLRYVRALHARGAVAECHLWDYTRNESDAAYLTEVCGPPANWRSGVDDATARAVTRGGGEMRIGDELQLRLDARKASCALVSVEYGKTDGTRATALIDMSHHGTRINGRMMRPVLCNHINRGRGLTDVVVRLLSGGAISIADGLGTAATTFLEDFDASAPARAEFRTNLPARWAIALPFADMRRDANNFILRMGVAIGARNTLGWNAYYAHYTPQRYPNHVIVKCDDDVPFIDLHDGAFEAFAARAVERAAQGYACAFASIVNNGVCAHYQQQRWGLVPASFGDSLPYDTLEGKLWANGALAQRLHEAFLEHREPWLERSRALPPLDQPVGDRLSINFFAIHTSQLDAVYRAIAYSDHGDEYGITVALRLRTYVDPGLTVAHLAFGPQRALLDEPGTLAKYAAVADAQGI